MHRNSAIGVLLLATFLLASAPKSEACQVCVPFPGESLADRILAAEHLVLARENPDQPFTLQAIRTIRQGDPVPPPLELFLDSSTRRQLSLDEDLSILCEWSPGTGKWRRLALNSRSLAPVVEAILQNREAWEVDPAARVDYFAGYLAHEASVLSDLARIEVYRAPYDQLIRYADRIPREVLLERLANPRLMEWHGLDILFLARTGIPEDQELIREKVENDARWPVASQRTAWAIALIEIDGMAGIERISQLYLNGPDRSPEDIAAIREAFRIHAEHGRPELRDPIANAIRPLEVGMR